MSLSASVSQFTSPSRAYPGSSLGIHASRFVSGPSPQALPSPTPHAAVGVTLQPAGLCEQLTPRLLAPGPEPAAPLCHVFPLRFLCISTMLPCGPGSRDPNDLAPRTTSQVETWRSPGQLGGGRPERRWRVSPSNTHPAPRPPREPAASPWPRKAVGAQSAATGDGPRR